MNEHDTIRYRTTPTAGARFNLATAWRRNDATHPGRRDARLPRIQLRGDRRMLRALRAAEMAAWERAPRSLFRLRAQDVRSA